MYPAKFFAAQHVEKVNPKNVPDLVEEFIAAKAKAGVGRRAIADYRSRLGRFAAAFRCPVSSITKDHLQEFLDSLKIGLRTKKNFKTSLITFFNHARAKNCLPRDRKTEAEYLDEIEVPPSEIEMFSPKGLAKLLANAGPWLVPYLVIRAFAGVRDSEINRMEWRHVKFKDRQIQIPAAAAKRTGAGITRRCGGSCQYSRTSKDGYNLTLDPRVRFAGTSIPSVRHESWRGELKLNGFTMVSAMATAVAGLRRQRITRLLPTKWVTRWK